MSSELYDVALHHLKSTLPELRLRSYLAIGTSDSIGLDPMILSFDYAIISQRRYWAMSATSSSSNSLIAVSTGIHNEVVVGELLTIFVLDQVGVGRRTYGHVRWLVPCVVDRSNTMWSSE